MIFSFFKRKKTYKLSDKDYRWLDPKAVEIIRDLKRGGHQAYLVGGCVRDLLLGLKPKDFDIATSASPENVKRNVRRSQIIGKRFRIALARRPRQMYSESIHSLFPALDDNFPHEYQITTFRREPEIDESGRCNENVYGDMRQDAFRRDFTLNALYLDPLKKEIIDYTGGYEDILSKKLKVIGNPTQRFKEDPIRIFRAIRFLYRGKMDWDKKTYRSLEENLSELKNAKKERLREEIFKCWREGATSNVFSFFLEKGIWSYLAPLYASKWARDPIYHKQVFDFARAVENHPWPQSRVSTPYIFLMTYDYWMRHNPPDRHRFEELLQLLHVSKKERIDLIRIASVLRKLKHNNFDSAKKILTRISPFLYHIHSQCFYLIQILSHARVEGYEEAWKICGEEWKTYLDKSRKILIHRAKSHKT
jgi:poly(A) polymerase